MSQRKPLSSHKSESDVSSIPARAESESKALSPGKKALLQTFITPIVTTLSTFGPELRQMRAQVRNPIKPSNLAIISALGYKTASGSIKANSAGQSAHIKAGIESKLNGERAEAVVDGVAEEVGSSRSTTLISSSATVVFSGIFSATSIHYPSTSAAMSLINQPYHQSLESLSYWHRVRQVYNTGFGLNCIRESSNVAVYLLFFNTLRENIDQSVPSGFGLPVTFTAASLTGSLTDTFLSRIRYRIIEDASLSRVPGMVESLRSELTTHGFVHMCRRGFGSNLMATGRAFAAIKGVDWLINEYMFPDDKEAPAVSAAPQSLRVTGSKSTLFVSTSVVSEQVRGPVAPATAPLPGREELPEQPPKLTRPKTI